MTCLFHRLIGGLNPIISAHVLSWHIVGRQSAGHSWILEWTGEGIMREKMATGKRGQGAGGCARGRGDVAWVLGWGGEE